MSALSDPQGGIDALRGFIAAHARLFVLTGAGISTASGIPDYGSNGRGTSSSC